MTLQKLIGLCYVTDELLEDSGALGTFVTRAFTEEMIFKVEEAIFNGSGVGQPLGLLNSAAAFEVTKDAGDSGATISTNDVLNMWKRLWGPSRQFAAWFINPDVEEQLYPLTLGAGTGARLLYTPAGPRPPGNSS